MVKKAKIKVKKTVDKFNLLAEEPIKRVGTFEEIEGDLIKLAKKGEFDFIGHGCNCFATMGAGIALPISIEFPEAKAADSRFEAPSYMRLGNFTLGMKRINIKGILHPLRIVNFYSQYEPGRNLDTEALILSLRKFALLRTQSVGVFTDEQWRIGLPLIGCGIAGGNWQDVREIIKTELSEFDVTIVHFKE